MPVKNEISRKRVVELIVQELSCVYCSYDRSDEEGNYCKKQDTCAAFAKAAKETDKILSFRYEA